MDDRQQQILKLKEESLENEGGHSFVSEILTVVENRISLVDGRSFLVAENPGQVVIVEGLKVYLVPKAKSGKKRDGEDEARMLAVIFARGEFQVRGELWVEQVVRSNDKKGEVASPTIDSVPVLA